MGVPRHPIPLTSLLTRAATFVVLVQGLNVNPLAAQTPSQPATAVAAATSPATQPPEATTEELAEAARAAYDRGDYPVSATLYQRASDRDPNDPSLAYNAACAHALAGREHSALDLLERSIAAGLRAANDLASDPDLVSLRQHPRFLALAARLDRLIAEEALRRKSPAWESPWQPTVSEDLRVGGLARLWAEVNANFANFDLVPLRNGRPLDWDAHFLAFLPEVRAATTTRDYYQVLRRFIAALGDGHTGINLPQPLLDELLARPAIRTRLVALATPSMADPPGARIAAEPPASAVVIVGIDDPSLDSLGLRVGQQLLRVDGIDVHQYAADRVIPYQAVSTPQDLAVRSYEYELLTGAAGTTVRLALREANGDDWEIEVPRVAFAVRRALRAAQPPYERRTLPGNIALITLRSFEQEKVASDFAADFPALAQHAGWIFDLRDNGGGNSGNGYQILGHLTDRPFATSCWHTRVLRPTLRAWGYGENTFGGCSERQPAGGDRHYRGPVATLLSARTYSAAEDFAVAFDVLDRGPLVGEPTGGSTGQPLFITLPGGGGARICTKRDRYPDGREFVGRGVMPDIAVVPTLADLLAGRDIVLDAALAAITARSTPPD